MVKEKPHFTRSKEKSINEEGVRKFYKLLNHIKLGLTEIRIIDPQTGFKGIGFFDDEDNFVKACKLWNGKANIYAGRNPRPYHFKELFPQSYNKLSLKAKGGKSEDIEWVTGISLDIDPKRSNKDQKSPATEEEHILAINTTLHISYDFENAIVIDSGNGAYIWWQIKPYKINGDYRELEAKIKAWEEGMRERIEETPGLELDSMHDLARIKKVAGTWNVKGEDTPERPHRIAEFISNDDISQSDILDEILAIKVQTERSKIDINLGDISNSLPQRFNELLDKDKTLKATWEGERDDELKDHTRSGYDMSLADQLVKYNFSDNEIATIMRQSPSGKGAETTPQYLSLTISKAQSSIKQKAENKKNKEVSEDYLKYCEGKTFCPPLLSNEIMSEHKFIYTAGELWLYKDGVYVEGGEKLVKALCRHKLNNQSRQHRTTEVLFDIQVALQLDEDLLNSNSYILNLKNGLLDIRTLKLKPHTPDYYSTVQIPIRYDPQAICPKIDKFFSEVMPPDCMPLAYEMCGYCLLPLTPYHNAVMLVGEGRNGKSTFLDLLIRFLGKGNTSNIPLQDLTDNRFKRADLFGKLANIFADLDSRSLKSTSYFKTIVSGDRIDAERKHKDPFYFQPYAKLLFSTNEMPKSRDRSYAYYKRWIIIPFPNKFIKGTANYNPNILEEISTPEELSGLLNKAIKGLKRLEQDKGFIEPQSTKNALEDYMLSNDNVLLFVNECCDLEDKEATSGRTEVFKRYRGFCESANLHPISQRVFNKRIEDLGVTRGQEGTKRIWKGLELKDLFTASS